MIKLHRLTARRSKGTWRNSKVSVCTMNPSWEVSLFPPRKLTSLYWSYTLKKTGWRRQNPYLNIAKIISQMTTFSTWNFLGSDHSAIGYCLPNPREILRGLWDFQRHFRPSTLNRTFSVNSSWIPILLCSKLKPSGKLWRKSLLPHTTAWKITALEFNLSEQSSYYQWPSL